jgi:hypothetical protein
MMETIVGLSRPLYYTLHQEKATFGILLQVSLYLQKLLKSQ